MLLNDACFYPLVTCEHNRCFISWLCKNLLHYVRIFFLWAYHLPSESGMTIYIGQRRIPWETAWACFQSVEVGRHCSLESWPEIHADRVGFLMGQLELVCLFLGKKGILICWVRIWCLWWNESLWIVLGWSTGGRLSQSGKFFVAKCVIFVYRREQWEIEVHALGEIY